VALEIALEASMDHHGTGQMAAGTRSLSPWTVFAVAAVLSLVWSSYFLPIYMDDAYIGYRYVERLLDGKGLTWNDGEYVEGYSNLFWLLLVAAGGLLNRNLPLVGWILGLAANVATLAAVVWAFARSLRDSWLPVIAAASVLVLSATFAFWAVGGLETACVAALLAWAFAMLHRARADDRNWAWAGLLLGLLAISRPDGILFAIGTAAGAIVRGWPPDRTVLRRVAKLLLFPVLFVAAQLCFRIFYYDALVPTPAHQKLAFTLVRLLQGLVYLRDGILANGAPFAVVLLATVALVRARRWSALREAALFVVPATLWLSYITVIGGDLFGYQRHWMLPLVCMAFSLGSLLAAVAPRAARGVGIAFATAIAAHLVLQVAVSPYPALRIRSPADELVLKKYLEFAPDAITNPLEVGRRDMVTCVEIGRFLRRAFGAQRPLIAVNYAGCMPYSSQLPSLDMLGLTDRHIAEHRPPDMGHGRLAHELGDGAYVLSRKPDLIALCVPAIGASDPCMRGDLEMVGMPEFREYYRLVFYRSAGVDAALWTRIENGRLGIVRTPDTIRVPGYLLASRQGVRAVLNSAGEPVASLERGEAAIEDVRLPPGVWDVSLQATASSRARILASSGPGAQVEGVDAVRIESSGGPITFKVAGGPALINEIVAKRVGERYSSN
jgi:hypothetical protein